MEGAAMRREGVAMGRMIGMVVVALAVLTTLSACQSLTGKSAGTNVDDASITAAVKSKLVAEKATNLTRVDVDTNNGTVYLTGSVESADQKTRAEQFAWQAKGVKNVVNNLQVQKR
jgi:osmotically-inducible protein OsmY